MELRAERNQVGELSDGRKVAQPGELLEADGIEVVAGQQAQIGVRADDHARLAVVEEVALANRLDHERVSGGLIRSGRSSGDEVPQRGGRGRVGDVRGDDGVLGAKLRGQGVEGGGGLDAVDYRGRVARPRAPSAAASVSGQVALRCARVLSRFRA